MKLASTCDNTKSHLQMCIVKFLETNNPNLIRVDFCMFVWKNFVVMVFEMVSGYLSTHDRNPKETKDITGIDYGEILEMVSHRSKWVLHQKSSCYNHTKTSSQACLVTLNETQNFTSKLTNLNWKSSLMSTNKLNKTFYLSTKFEAK